MLLCVSHEQIRCCVQGRYVVHLFVFKATTPGIRQPGARWEQPRLPAQDAAASERARQRDDADRGHIPKREEER